MKLYFGNAVTTATTLMILALLGFIGWSLFNRVNIPCWGRRSAAVLIFGLVVCCFAAARDGLDIHIYRSISRTSVKSACFGTETNSTPQNGTAISKRTASISRPQRKALWHC